MVAIQIAPRASLSPLEALRSAWQGEADCLDIKIHRGNEGCGANTPNHGMCDEQLQQWRKNNTRRIARRQELERLLEASKPVHTD